MSTGQTGEGNLKLDVVFLISVQHLVLSLDFIFIVHNKIKTMLFTYLTLRE